MSFETSGLSIDALLDLILLKLPEEARSARSCSRSEVRSVAGQLSTPRALLTPEVAIVSEA